MRTIKVVNVEPDDPAVNTLYYIQTDDPNTYDVVLFDSQLNRIPLGTSTVGTYSPGNLIEIDVNNIVSVKSANEINETSTNLTAATSKSVYDFVMQGASSINAGKRGIVPAPAAGETNYVLRGDGVWAEIVDDLLTPDANLPLSANQGKELKDTHDEFERYVKEDRLEDDVAWTKLATTDKVGAGEVWIRKRNAIIELSVVGVKAITPANVVIANLGADFKPAKLTATTVVALNNSNATAGLSIDTDGAIKLYSATGAYNYWGTLTYIL